MLWLAIILSAYFLLGAVNLVDKYVLGERIQSPKVYTFYVGLSGIFILALAPFGFLAIPDVSGMALALLAGIAQTLAILVLFTGLKNFEASRIIPAIGAFLPLFTFGFSFIYSGGKDSWAPLDVAAFSLLLLGSFLVTFKKTKLGTGRSLKIAALAAFLFATYFIMLKFVYLSQPFISGLIWTRVGACLAALGFLFFEDVRKDIKAPQIAQKKSWAIVLPNQAAGGTALILQNWAIALAPLSFLGIINALEGVKYVFLLIFAVFLSVKFPHILKEEISKEVLYQKIVAILLIGAGLAILAF